MKRGHTKRIGLLWLVGTTFGATGAAYGQLLDDNQMQMLLGQAEQIERCMAQTSDGATQDLLQRGERMSKEIENLCKAGKRDAAQAMALAFGREVADSPAMNNLQECAGPLGALLPAALATLQGDAAAAMQVCDVQ
jgi:hypothetical protein